MFTCLFTCGETLWQLTQFSNFVTFVRGGDSHRASDVPLQIYLLTALNTRGLYLKCPKYFSSDLGSWKLSKLESNTFAIKSIDAWLLNRERKIKSLALVISAVSFSGSVLQSTSAVCKELFWGLLAIVRQNLFSDCLKYLPWRECLK